MCGWCGWWSLPPLHEIIQNVPGKCFVALINGLAQAKRSRWSRDASGAPVPKVQIEIVRLHAVFSVISLCICIWVFCVLRCASRSEDLGLRMKTDLGRGACSSCLLEGASEEENEEK